MRDAELILNPSTVTQIEQGVECIYAKVDVDGVTVSVIYDRISKDVTVYRGYTNIDTYKQLADNLPAYLDTYFEQHENIPEHYPDEKQLRALDNLLREMIDCGIISAWWKGLT